jgi:hypothetical protein
MESPNTKSPATGDPEAISSDELAYLQHITRLVADYHNQIKELKPRYDKLLGESRAKECAVEEYLEYLQKRYNLQDIDILEFETGIIKRQHHDQPPKRPRNSID